MFKKIALVAVASLALTGCWEVQNGEKIGRMTRIADQGLFIKTHEAELVRGGFTDGSGVSGAAFHFTIEDEAMLKAASAALEAQQEVKITFAKEKFTFLRSESDGYFLKSLEVIKKPVAQGVTATATASDKQAVIVELLKVQAQLIQQLAN